MIPIIPWEDYAKQYYYRTPDGKLHIKKGTPEPIAKRLEADVLAYMEKVDQMFETDTYTSDYLDIQGIVYD